MPSLQYCPRLKQAGLIIQERYQPLASLALVSCSAADSGTDFQNCHHRIPDADTGRAGLLSGTLSARSEPLRVLLLLVLLLLLLLLRTSTPAAAALGTQSLQELALKDTKFSGEIGTFVGRSAGSPPGDNRSEYSNMSATGKHSGFVL